MKNKALISLLATATIGVAVTAPAVISHQNTTHIINKVLMVNNTSSSTTNEAVVVNGNSNMNLYGLANGRGIVSYLSTGEMLTILGHQQGDFCKVKVQETGAVGYINISNMQNIINGTSDKFTNISGNGSVVNVSTRLRLRNNPSINANINGYLTNGDQFSILGKQGQWYKISINGQVGFIYQEYANINSLNTSTSSSSSNSSSGITNKTKKIVVNNNDTIGNSSSKSSSAKSLTTSQGNNNVMSLANIQTTAVDQMVQYFRSYDASQHIPAKDLGSPKLFYQTAQFSINQYVTQNSLKDVFGMNGPTYNNIKVNSYYSSKKVLNAINIPQRNWSTTGDGYYVVSIQKI